MLRVRNLDFNYGAKKILKNITLSFEEPALVALLGHNGSGKSTLLKVLGASCAAQKGSIEILGEDALDRTKLIKTKLRHKLGLVFQETSSDIVLTARDNLFYFARLMNVTQSEQALRVEETLKLANLSDRALDSVKKFSHGMRRRLEIYRAFMHKPKLLLLDEPTEGLDFVETARFWEFVKDYSKREKALVLLATHRAFELEHCDSIVMLHEGAIIAQNSPDEFLSALNYVHVEVSLKEANKNNWKAPQKLLFKAQSDKPHILKTQIHTSNLSEILSYDELYSHEVQSLRWQRPEIKDAYELRIKNHVN